MSFLSSFSCKFDDQLSNNFHRCWYFLDMLGYTKWEDWYMTITENEYLPFKLIWFQDKDHDETYKEIKTWIILNLNLKTGFYTWISPLWWDILSNASGYLWLLPDFCWEDELLRAAVDKVNRLKVEALVKYGLFMPVYFKVESIPGSPVGIVGLLGPTSWFCLP